MIATGHGFTTLDLSQNDITFVGAGRLADVLTGPNKLTELHLSWNQLRDAGAAAVATALAAPAGPGVPLKSPALKKLSMAWTGSGPLAGAQWAQVIANHSLEYLDLSNNRMDASVGALLAQSIPSNKLLKYINLFGNPFGSVC
jgi:Ran GTPase-activating protein (RanGAP) involved in mRNA processing and transport